MRGARTGSSTAEPSFVSRFRTTLEIPRASPVSPTDETSEINPLRPGPYPTCASAPTLFGDEQVRMIAYAPGTQISSKTCESATKDCPLVVLFHARPVELGEHSYFLQYETLGRHLASYGFVVVSVEWQDAISKPEQGKLLEALLTTINNGLLGLIKILTHRLVLIGHSRGGYIVDRSVASGLIMKTGFTLSAVVLMSPSDVVAASNTYTDPPIDALLVLHDVADSDSSANGGKSGFINADVVPACGVLAYELAGHSNGGSINSANPQYPKHLAYAHISNDLLCPPYPYGTHFYQSSAFASGYIVSFLLAYVRGHTAYKSYFRQQQQMSDISNVEQIDGIHGIWHMHSEPSESILVDWASPMAMAVVSGAEESGPITLPQGDDYGLNHGQVFRVQFIRGTQCSVVINFVPTKKLKEYGLISFGLCQSNVAGFEVQSPSTGAIAGSISLTSTQDDQTYGVKLHEIGGPLWYHGCLSSRRVCMEERVLPLSSVAQAVKLESINQIALRFDAFEDITKKAVIHIGNIKLIGKGP